MVQGPDAQPDRTAPFRLQPVDAGVEQRPPAAEPLPGVEEIDALELPVPVLGLRVRQAVRADEGVAQRLPVPLGDEVLIGMVGQIPGDRRLSVSRRNELGEIALGIRHLEAVDEGLQEGVASKAAQGCAVGGGGGADGEGHAIRL